jgi:ribosome-binding factor A
MDNNFDFKVNRKKRDGTIKSQRQLRVGEELRHLISNALHRETFYDEVIESSNITITEVNVSPDLKNAKVYIMPLGGKQKIEVLESLNKVKGHIKKLISSGITLRQIPKINFMIDNSFEYAKHIDEIIHKIKN